MSIHRFSHSKDHIDLQIKIKKSPDAIIPQRAKIGDAGYDLYSAEDCKIGRMARKLVSTGIYLEIPPGYYGRIAPRSGLAINHGIDVLGGVIDSGFRNEIKVILINLNPIIDWSDEIPGRISDDYCSENEFFEIKKGDRIAQIIFEKCEDVEFIHVKELGESERGQGGFGSSGIDAFCKKDPNPKTASIRANWHILDNGALTNPVKL